MYMLRKQTVRDIDVKGKVVLLRADYDLPVKSGKILDDQRIRASLSTLDYLLENGARKIIIISHLGRPKGRDESLSLTPVAQLLEKLLKEDVYLHGGSSALPDAKIVLMENLRFNKNEKEGDVVFAKKLVKKTKAEIFVQDAFSVTHLSHASVVAIPNFLPSVAGLLLEREINLFSKTMVRVKRPLLVILGGDDEENKRPLIDLLAKTADNVVLGGRIGFNFDHTALNVISPLDYRYGKDGQPYDIGDISTTTILNLIQQSKTIIWNGVVGKAEDKVFARASKLIAEEIGRNDAESIIIGGCTSEFVLALLERNPRLDISLYSTGGCSALGLILGNKLPGLEALLDK